MAGSESRVTAQHQTAVPAEVRRKLGIGPGTRLLWTVEGGRAVVSAKRNTLEDIHRLTANRKVKKASDAEIRAGIIAGAVRGRR